MPIFLVYTPAPAAMSEWDIILDTMDRGIGAGDYNVTGPEAFGARREVHAMQNPQNRRGIWLVRSVQLRQVLDRMNQSRVPCLLVR